MDRNVNGMTGILLRRSPSRREKNPLLQQNPRGSSWLTAALGSWEWFRPAAQKWAFQRQRVFFQPELELPNLICEGIESKKAV